MEIPHDVLIKIKEHNGWLSGFPGNGSLQFDFPTCNEARVAEIDIGNVPGWEIITHTCVLLFHLELK